MTLTAFLFEELSCKTIVISCECKATDYWICCAGLFFFFPPKILGGLFSFTLTAVMLQKSYLSDMHLLVHGSNSPRSHILCMDQVYILTVNLSIGLEILKQYFIRRWGGVVLLYTYESELEEKKKDLFKIPYIDPRNGSLCNCSPGILFPCFILPCFCAVGPLF